MDGPGGNELADTWLCSMCQTLNEAGQGTCAVCGTAPREAVVVDVGGPRVPEVPSSGPGADQGAASAGPNGGPWTGPTIPGQEPPGLVAQEVPAARQRWAIPAAVLLGVVVAGGIAFAATRSAVDDRDDPSAEVRSGEQEEESGSSDRSDTPSDTSSDTSEPSDGEAPELASEEPAGGRDVDVDADGNVTVTDEDGSTTEFGTGAELPDGWPADLAPPGSVDILTTSSGSTDGRTTLLLTAESEGAVGDLYASFKAQLEGAGYTITGDSSGEGYASLTADGNGFQANVSLVAEVSGAGKTSIVFSLESAD